MEDANEDLDVNICLESEREIIAVGLSVIGVVKLIVVLDWIHIGACRILGLRLKHVSAMRLRENGATARSATAPLNVTRVT